MAIKKREVITQINKLVHIARIPKSRVMHVLDVNKDLTEKDISYILIEYVARLSAKNLITPGTLIGLMTTRLVPESLNNAKQKLMIAEIKTIIETRFDELSEEVEATLGCLRGQAFKFSRFDTRQFKSGKLKKSSHYIVHQLE